MAFTTDSASATGTPAAAQLNYTGSTPVVTMGDANAAVACGGIYGLMTSGGPTPPAGTTKLTAVRVGYYTAAQGRSGAVFTAQTNLDSANPSSQNIAIAVLALANGTSYTFFAQGVY